MEVYIETPRLIIRPLELTDIDGMFEMDNDPEVHKYLGNKPVQTVEKEREYIAFIRQQYVENGIGRWAIEEKETGNFVGWTGFKLMKERINGHINFIDFGYRLMRKHWRKGYGEESARATLAYGLETYKYNPVYAMTDPENAGSRRILEKLGFAYKTTFPYDAEPSWRGPAEPTTWYELHVEK